MSEKQQLLKNADEQPTDKIIFEGLGKASMIYKEFIEELEKYGITLMKWRFYQDGKAWLTKGEYKWVTSRGTNKVKPIFWLSIWDGFFKVSFNFSEQTREDLLGLPLNEATKTMITHIQPNGNKKKFISVIFDVDNIEQLKDIYILSEFRKHNI